MFDEDMSQDTPKGKEHLDKLIEHAKHAKEKYDEMDDATKKKIMAGVAGALAVLGGIALFKKMKGKKDDESEF